MSGSAATGDTSWQEVSSWYDTLVGHSGSYYHERLILPNLLRLLALEPGSSLVDLGCGQGVLARHLPTTVSYTGIDLAQSLVQTARQYAKNNKRRAFLKGDITKPLPLSPDIRFSHAACVLALQNVAHPERVFAALAPHLAPDARLAIVLNHPCFRIPRQSQWEFDPKSKCQYRRINGYMTPQKIPIHMQPNKEKSSITWSFHHPLSSYASWLNANHFLIEGIEEWCSDKRSTGKAAAWENRARKEFPLFLAIRARYCPKR